MERPKNPWLGIPLADYEAHMELPSVGQAALIAAAFAGLLERFQPASVCLLGCAGGNGLERLSGTSVRRVVAVDINQDYVATARARYRHRISGLDVIVADAESESLVFPPVDLIFAPLLFEYVDLERALAFVRRHCLPGARLAALLQLPNAAIAEVTPSPYASLRELASIMRLISPRTLAQQAEAAGFMHMESRSLSASGGKSFALEVFQTRPGGGD